MKYSAMLKKSTCPYCGAAEFSEDSNGDLICEYCGGMVFEAAGRDDSDESQEALEDMKTQISDYARQKKRWLKITGFNLMILFFVMLAAGLTVELDYVGIGSLLAVAGAAFSFAAPVIQTFKKPNVPVVTGKSSKILSCLGMYARFFLVFWAGIFTAAIITVMVS